MTPIIIHFLFCFLSDLCQDRSKQSRGNLYGGGKMSWKGDKKQKSEVSFAFSFNRLGIEIMLV